MKKTILSLLAASIFTLSANAQNWNMVITKSDGSTIRVATTDISNITYVDMPEYLPDQNVDQVIIKEIYNGGCKANDGKNFQYDKSIILYNNCSQQAVINNLCIGQVNPANSNSKNDNYGEDGKLVYDSEGFHPIWQGYWYYPYSLTIEPYSQVVININGAIDNTQTVTNSINYANPDYYCFYDPENGLTHTGYYPTPSSVIPTSHYWKCKFVAMGNAWAYSVSSPATILFQVQDADASSWGDDANNVWYPGGQESAAMICLKVPTTWILDGVEIYNAAKMDDNTKRLTAEIDGGYVKLTNYMGHTVYRNVDKEATEALSENAGKLIYNYALGMDDSTDPSGIDAEASMKNGAHIIYLDTNNSTADFHERQQSSLK